MIEYVFEMNELERWYKSYKNNFQDILEEDKKKLEKLKGYLIDHRELYTSSFLMEFIVVVWQEKKGKMFMNMVLNKIIGVI